MPIYQLQCPQCRHQFSGMVFSGTRLPDVWVCPQCDSKQAQLLAHCRPTPHPLEASHGSGCPCCSGGDAEQRSSPTE